MIAERLQKLLKKASVTAYIGDLPSSPPNVVSIVLYTGNYNTEYFGTGTMCTPVAKIIVRNKSYSDGESIVDTIKNTLHRYSDDTLLSVLMQGYPSYLGRDPQKLHTFQIVFNIKVKE